MARVKVSAKADYAARAAAELATAVDGAGHGRPHRGGPGHPGQVPRDHPARAQARRHRAQPARSGRRLHAGAPGRGHQPRRRHPGGGRTARQCARRSPGEHGVPRSSAAADRRLDRRPRRAARDPRDDLAGQPARWAAAPARARTGGRPGSLGLAGADPRRSWRLGRSGGLGRSGASGAPASAGGSAGPGGTGGEGRGRAQPKVSSARS